MSSSGQIHGRSQPGKDIGGQSTRVKARVDYTLYLVTDRALIGGRNLAECVEEAIRGGVTVVQLREKSVTSREFLNLALQVRAVTEKYGKPLIINDRLDIALAVDADGLHLGQDDLPAPIARNILGPGKILGVSAATLEEAKKAEADGADYLGVGALYPTPTKSDTQLVTLETLRRIKENVHIPVVAIGGINAATLPPIRDTGIAGVAVVSAILGGENITAAARTLAGLMKQ